MYKLSFVELAFKFVHSAETLLPILLVTLVCLFFLTRLLSLLLV
jgi:hypothetical protein